MQIINYSGKYLSSHFIVVKLESSVVCAVVCQFHFHPCTPRGRVAAFGTRATPRLQPAGFPPALSAVPRAPDTGSAPHPDDCRSGHISTPSCHAIRLIAITYIRLETAAVALLLTMRERTPD